MSNPSRRERVSRFAVRYGLGSALILAGVVVVALDPALGGVGVDAFAIALGAGLSVLLLGLLSRLGVSGGLQSEPGRIPDAGPTAPGLAQWPRRSAGGSQLKWLANRRMIVPEIMPAMSRRCLM